MKHRLKTFRFSANSLICVWLFVCMQSSAFAENSLSQEPIKIKVDTFPEAAVHMVEESVRKEYLRLDQMNEIAAKQAEEYERNKVFAQQEIQRKKVKIEGVKIEQVKLQKEMQTIQADSTFFEAEVKNISSDLNKMETELAQFSNTYQGQKSEFEAKKFQYQQQIANLESTKRNFALRANQLQVDSERMRRNIAENDALISKTQNQLAHLQSETIHVETEYQDIVAKLSESKQSKIAVVSQLRDAERKLQQLQRSVAEGRVELKQIEQQQLKLASDGLKEKTRILAEAKKLEMQTVENNIAKMSLDADRMKYQNENEKFGTMLVAAKVRNETSRNELEHDRGLILESRFKAEKTQTEIALMDSQNKKAKLDNDTLHVKLRNLASLAADSGMSDAPVQVWIMVKNCFLRSSVSNDSVKQGLVKKDKIVGGQDEGSFVKVINNSGKPLYMPKTCMNLKEAAE
ncbi:MAG: hypothetical protein H7235_01045 [Bdellovibrionaceae bacterium]|nr:hypothetical protein [Pseudobdellovibrionaceae bacterium]